MRLGPEQAAVLRARRNELGLTLEQVERETKIPAAYLLALEEGRETDVPDGPWREGFLRTYRRRLGLEDEHPPSNPIPHARPFRVPLWGVRAIAATTAFLLVVAIVWRSAPRVASLGSGETDSNVAVADQEVRLVVSQRGRMRVRSDGQPVLDRVAERGEDLMFKAHDRIEVDLFAADAARVTYNGRPIVPQGRQDEPRRLVFIDDNGGR